MMERNSSNRCERCQDKKTIVWPISAMINATIDATIDAIINAAAKTVCRIRIAAKNADHLGLVYK